MPALRVSVCLPQLATRLTMVAEDQIRGGTEADATEDYRLVFEGSPEPTWIYDIATMEFVAVNDAACERYGYPRSEFLTLSLVDIRPVEDREAFRAAVRPAELGTCNHGVSRHRHRDGTVFR